MSTPKYTSKDIARFWSKVSISANTNKCWEWQAGKDEDGYGRFSIRKQVKAHRFVWMITNGEIPDNLYVCHECDNPSCVNPKHLFLGTNLDNTRDKVAKNRQARGVELARFGELNPQHKLTTDQVRLIRQRYSEEKISHRKLAKELGLTSNQVYAVISGKYWRGV